MGLNEPLKGRIILMPVVTASTDRQVDAKFIGSVAMSEQPLLPPDANAEARRAAVYLVMAQIPEGKVVSYGELAAMAGLGRAARWVGRLMSQLPDDTRLPWHRVIAAGGRLSLPPGSAAGHEQRQRLRGEGLTIINDRVDIRRHGWHSFEHSE